MLCDRKFSQVEAALLRFHLACRSAVDTTTQRLREERGASMVEYGLLLAFALLVAFAIVTIFGQRVLGLFEAVDTEFQSVGGAGGGGQDTGGL